MAQVSYRFDPSINSNVIPSITGGGTQTTTDITNDDGTITRTITFTSNPSRLYFGNQGTESKALLDVYEYPINSSMTSFYYLFDGCTNLRTICGNDLSSWDVSKITDMDYTFRNCSSLTELNLSGWKMGQTSYRGSFLSGCTSLHTINLSGLTTGNASISGIFSNCKSLTKVIMENSSYSEINKIIGVLPTVTAGEISVVGVDDEASINVSSANSKGWSIVNKIKVAVYTINTTTLVVPTFNEGFAYTSETEAIEGGLKCTIYPVDDEILPTSIKFDNDSIYIHTVDYINIACITDMSNMFDGCINMISVNTGQWDTSQVQSMSCMFYECKQLTTLDVSNWNMTNVKNISSIFMFCENLSEIIGLENWDTSNINNMVGMFCYCSSLKTLNLSTWSHESLNYGILHIFNGCSGLEEINLKGWNVPYGFINNVFVGEYPNLKKLNISSSNLETVYGIAEQLPTVNSADFIIAPIKIDESLKNEIISNGWNVIDELQIITKYHTYNISEIPYLGTTTEYFIDFEEKSDCSFVTLSTIELPDDISFANMYYLKSVDYICDFKLPVNTKFSFAGTQHIDSVDVSNVDTSEVTSFYNWFGNTSIKEIKGIENWNTSNVTNMIMTFYGTDLNYLDLSNWDVRKVNDMSNMFYNSSLKELDITGWETSSLANVNSMFISSRNLTNIIGIEDLDTSNVTYMNSMFEECQSLVLDNKINNWDVGNVTNMSYMFGECYKIKELDLSKWDVSNVQSFTGMFYECRLLETINGLSLWDTHNATSMETMFNRCYNIKDLRSIENWDISNVEDISSMFNMCESITYLDLSKWNTDKIEDIGYVFESCINLAYLDISGWNTSNIWDFGSLFSKCKNLHIIKGIEDLNTNNMTNMSYIFDGCESLVSLDLSKWNLSKIATIDRLKNIIKDCHNLKLFKLNNNSSHIINIPDLEGLRYLVCDNSAEIKVEGCKELQYIYIDTITNNNLTKIINNVSDRSNKDGKGVIHVNNISVDKPITRPTNATFEGSYGTMNNYDKMFDDDDTTYGYFNTKGSNVKFLFDFNNSFLPSDVTNCDGIYVNIRINANYSDISCSLYINEERVLHKTLSTTVTTHSVELTKEQWESILNGNFYLQVSGASNTQFRLYDINISYEGLDVPITIDYDTLNNKNWVIEQNIYTVAQFEYEGTFNYNMIPMTDVSDYLELELNSSKRVVTLKSTVLPTKMIFNSDAILSITQLNLQNITNIEDSIIQNCTKLKSIEDNWGPFRPEGDLVDVIVGCPELETLNISGWICDKITNIQRVFSDCSNIKHVYLDSFINDDMVMHNLFDENIDIETVYMTHSIVSNINKLIDNIPDRTGKEPGYLNTYYVIGDNPLIVDQKLNKTLANSKNWNIDNYILVADIDIDIDKNTGKLQPSSDIKCYCSDYTDDPTKLIIVAYDYPGWISFDSMTQITKVNYIETRKLNDMYTMFRGCENLTEIVGIEDWDVSNVTSMWGSFDGCVQLVLSDLSRWDTSKVTDMYSVFYECMSITTLDLSNWDTSKVTDMSFMFYCCQNLKEIKGIENWNTSNVDTLYEAFHSCLSLKTLDLSGWDVSKLRVLTGAFQLCPELEEIKGIENWNTVNCINAGYVFFGCLKLKYIDISKWNTGQMTRLDGSYGILEMFGKCKSIEVLDLRNWVLNNSMNIGGDYDIPIHGNESLRELYLPKIVINHDFTKAEFYNMIIDELPDRSTTTPGILYVLNDDEVINSLKTAKLNGINWKICNRLGNIKVKNKDIRIGGRKVKSISLGSKRFV